MNKPDPWADAHPDDDQLLDLVRGLTEPDERQSLLTHLMACPACEERFRLRAASHARSESESMTIPAAPAAIPRARATRPVVPALLLVAAAGLVAFWLLRLLSREPAALDDRFDQVARLPPATLRGIVRSAANSAADSVVMAGLAAYDRGDLETACRLLESVAEAGRLEPLRRVYLGNGLLTLGRSARAAVILRGVRWANIPEPWSSETRWALFLALLRSGQAAAADSVVQELALDPTELGERARQYLASRRPGR